MKLLYWILFIIFYVTNITIVIPFSCKYSLRCEFSETIEYQVYPHSGEGLEKEFSKCRYLQAITCKG